MEWISVKDSLPKDDYTKICIEYRKNIIPAPDEIYGACYVNGIWTNEPYGDYNYNLPVTHWMPFPKLPINK